MQWNANSPKENLRQYVVLYGSEFDETLTDTWEGRWMDFTPLVSKFDPDAAHIRRVKAASH